MVPTFMHMRVRLWNILQHLQELYIFAKYTSEIFWHKYVKSDNFAIPGVLCSCCINVFINLLKEMKLRAELVKYLCTQINLAIPLSSRLAICVEY